MCFPLTFKREEDTFKHFFMKKLTFCFPFTLNKTNYYLKTLLINKYFLIILNEKTIIKIFFGKFISLKHIWDLMYLEGNIRILIDSISITRSLLEMNLCKELLGRAN